MKACLICIPWAGASAQSFLPLAKLLQSGIEFCPLELPGRGRRFYDPGYRNMDQCVEDLAQKVLEISKKRPYALLGHSLGCQIAWELAIWMQDRQHLEPIAFFASGRQAPDQAWKLDTTNPRQIDEPQRFWDYLVTQGVVESHMHGHQEFLSHYRSVVEADYRLSQTCTYEHGDRVLDCPIQVINGQCDPVVSSFDLKCWSRFTRKSCNYHLVEGSYHFITEKPQAIAKIINQSMTKICCPAVR